MPKKGRKCIGHHCKQGRKKNAKTEAGSRAKSPAKEHGSESAATEDEEPIALSSTTHFLLEEDDDCVVAVEDVTEENMGNIPQITPVMNDEDEGKPLINKTIAQCSAMALMYVDSFDAPPEEEWDGPDGCLTKFCELFNIPEGSKSCLKKEL